MEQAEVLRCDSLPVVTLSRTVSHWLVSEEALRIGRGLGKGKGGVGGGEECGCSGQVPRPVCGGTTDADAMGMLQSG